MRGGKMNRGISRHLGFENTHNVQGRASHSESYHSPAVKEHLVVGCV